MGQENCPHWRTTVSGCLKTQNIPKSLKCKMQSKEVGRERGEKRSENGSNAAADVGRACFWRIPPAKVRSLEVIRGYQIWVLGS